MLQALHERSALRERLHQYHEQVQEPAGVRMLRWPKRSALILASIAAVLGLMVAVDHWMQPLPQEWLGTRYNDCKTTEIKEGNLDVVRRAVSRHLKEYLPERKDEKSRADFACLVLDDFNWWSVEGNLPYALFKRARLERATFGQRWRPGASTLNREANFEGADFTLARLEETNFQNVRLKGAIFLFGKLDEADFTGADIRDTNFMGASVAGVVFEPRAGFDSRSIELAVGVELLRYKQSARALLELREGFKKAGRRDLERRVTYAIETTRTAQLFEQKKAIPILEAAVRTVAWRLPTAYDLQPERALLLLLMFVLLFSVPYWLSFSNVGEPMIWKVLPADRLNGDGKLVFLRVRATGLNRTGYALMFSVFSAFTLGWRDLNVGMWLSRLQGTEYALRGSGWVRTLSGIQSLLSVYLLAMWALTQFGRLFEG
jgi:hypothetical protein